MNLSYSVRFDPPAPVVSLWIRSPGTRTWVTVDALVDSGADLCGIPESLAASLDLPPVRVAAVAGFVGQQEAIIYRVDLKLDGHGFNQVEALVLGRPYALVGRNVLRHLVTTLDGPRARIGITRPRR